MRVLRRALLLLGLLAGLFAMHGLAPADGTDILATGPHQHPAAHHPAALLAAAGPTHGLAAAPSNRAVTDEGMPGEAMPAPPPAVASSGTPSPGHGGHGSHLGGLCLAVLAGGVAFLTLAVLGRPGSRARAHAVLGRVGRHLASASPLRPPGLSRLCVLRI